MVVIWPIVFIQQLGRTKKNKVQWSLGLAFYSNYWLWDVQVCIMHEVETIIVLVSNIQIYEKQN
jgi:hypothetical protein